MRFFFVNGRSQAEGPVEAAALQELRRAGAVTGSTRVCREGDTAWRTFDEFFGPGAASGAEPGPAGGPPDLPAPLSPMVFGICNVVFGILGILCTPAMTLIVLFGGSMHAEASAVFRGWLVFSGVFGFFLSAALLAAGIGLIRYRRWAYTLTLAYCLADVAFTFLHAGITWQWGDSWYGETAALARLARVVIELALGVLYAVAMFLVLRQPAVRNYFQARE